VWALAVAVQRFEIKGQLAHVFRLKAACLQLKWGTPHETEIYVVRRETGKE
jgi:hypothetical protein